MLTIYSCLHHRHHGNAELIDGKMMPCFEMPRRAEMILERVREVGLGEVRDPDRFGEAPVRRGARTLLDGAPAVFSLCRPPGHHAATAAMGGYCYLNNAAIAVQYLVDQGRARVAILDVDYHHGNGTQEIFYSRGDVLFLSLHADPRVEYPYFLGYADERGAGAGLGFTHNYPLPHGTTWEAYGPALDDACAKVEAFRPDALVVSLGVDTYEHDPISQFRLRTEDFPKIGARIAAARAPTLFVMEGGYAVEDIGVNAVNVLTGFA